MEEEQDWYGAETATFGDRLEGAREAAGLSQKDLADRLGVRLRTIRQWEEDLSEPRSNKLTMLSGMLNVSIRWLLTGEGEGPSAPREAGAEAAALLGEMKAIRLQMKGLASRLSTLESRLAERLDA